MRGFVLAGTKSGIGKTTLAMGLMASYENVSPFKVGPDYIDPSFHRYVTKNPSYNLDLFMMGEQGVKYSFIEHSKEISIVEGVMGLYDGLGHELENFSTAHVAKILNLPVILVVDCKGKSTSIAAEILGYKMLDPDIKIAGVIINRVNSEKLYEMLKEAIERYTKIECLGYLKNDENLAISSRHLGLLQAEEVEDLDRKMEVLKTELKKTVNLERIYEIAELGERKKVPHPLESYKMMYKGKNIGIAKDSAFSFYYEDNIELFRYLGMNITYFSPLKDKKIPDVDVLYFGGGYPENFAKELYENKEMVENIKRFCKENGRIYAECGGFMYLTKGIKLLNDEYIPMCEIIDCDVIMREKLDISRFGYLNLVKNGKHMAKGHEFHYSKIENIYLDTRKYTAEKDNGKAWSCIFEKNNCKAGYPHIHFFTGIEYLKECL